MAVRHYVDQDPLPGMPDTSQERFDPEQLRAFGSIPGLLGKELDIPPFHRLDSRALLRVEPVVIRHGLYGREGANVVNGIVLSSEEYVAIVRNRESFQYAIQAKTGAANRLTGDVRTEEKQLRSLKGAFDNKLRRHNLVSEGLASERGTLTKLAGWQHTPGYWKTKEADIRALAGSAWNGSFQHILEVLRDKHGLDQKQHVDNVNAMAYKLFRGGQRDRIAYWGEMLGVALEYNKRRELLFSLSARDMVRESGRVAVKLQEFYDKHGIPPK